MTKERHRLILLGEYIAECFAQKLYDKKDIKAEDFAKQAILDFEALQKEIDDMKKRV